jgi:hypothetical protein
MTNTNAIDLSNRINNICANALLNYALSNNDHSMLNYLIGHNHTKYLLSDYSNAVTIISKNIRLINNRNIPVSSIDDIPPLFVAAYEHGMLQRDLYQYYHVTETDKYFAFLRYEHKRIRKKSISNDLLFVDFARNWNKKLDDLVAFARDNNISIRQILNWLNMRD